MMLHCVFSVPSDVDLVLEDLLRQMLAKEPDDRPTVQAVMNHDWCQKRFPKTGQVGASRRLIGHRPEPIRLSESIVQYYLYTTIH